MVCNIQTHAAILIWGRAGRDGTLGGLIANGLPSQRVAPPPSLSPPDHTGLLPSLVSLNTPPPPAASPPSHRSLSWSSVPGSGCTTKWIDVMFHSPSRGGGGQRPSAQAGNGGTGVGKKDGRARGNLGASFRVAALPACLGHTPESLLRARKTIKRGSRKGEAAVVRGGLRRRERVRSAPHSHTRRHLNFQRPLSFLPPSLRRAEERRGGTSLTGRRMAGLLSNETPWRPCKAGKD